MAERISGHGRPARIIVGIGASLALIVGLITTGVTVRWVQLRDLNTDPTFGDGVDPAGSPTTDLDECASQVCNYLLVGSDSRAGLTPEQQEQFAPDESLGGTNRADTIMLVHTDPSLRRAIVVSFPRDLWVAIPDAATIASTPRSRAVCAVVGPSASRRPWRTSRASRSTTTCTSTSTGSSGS